MPVSRPAGTAATTGTGGTASGPTDAAGLPEESGRRSVVPGAAGRSLWRAAAWTGAGAALTGLIAGIVVVAVCWLPVSGGSGSAGSVMRAGSLTFLAALHGGITVDGTPAAFVPLGMTLLVVAIAWRAGSGLADAADELEEAAPARLVAGGAVQAAAFAVVCALAAALSPLGTSHVPVFGAAVAGFLVCAVGGGAALLRWSALGDSALGRLAGWVPDAARAAAGALAAYLGAGALLVAGALVVNHDRVQTLSGQVGGGWSGIPVLALGLLAAPNAGVAGAGYLAGPGFSVGTGAHVSLFSTAHGLLPAFPVLGAVPTGHGAPWPVWVLAALAMLAAGSVAARVAWREPVTRARARTLAATAGMVTVAGLVLGWQSGGAIGDGRLAAVGPSPWQLALALGVAVGAAGATLLGVAALAQRWRVRSGGAPAEPGLLRSVIAEGVATYHETADKPGERPGRRSADEAAAPAADGQRRDHLAS